jgi:glyoxylase-like metal-dependent hydrolase (beta-lactamase superfamily II)
MAAPTTERPRRQEQEPASAEVTEMAPGILRSQLPISLPGLGHVNCYFLEDERGVAIVDPGLPGPQSWRALVDRLKRAGYKPRNVHTVIVTHSHPDHFGGAGRLRDTYGAEVISHRSFRTWFDPAEDEEALSDEPEDHEGGTPAVKPWGRQMPWRDDVAFQPPLSRRLKFGLYRTALKRFMKTPSPTRRVDDAEVITLARREWVSLHTPGHTNDHLCLFDPAGGIVLSGDHVLPTITPHIGGMTEQPDPLARFFDSLGRMEELDGVRLALPAHGHPFTDLAGRAAEIRQHHLERLDILRHAGDELGVAPVETFMERLFRERSWGEMAASETWAHLEHLRVLGAAEAVEVDGVKRYRVGDPADAVREMA